MNNIIENTSSLLALVTGRWDGVHILAEKLRKGNCQVIATDKLPTSGKFDYIFLFGSVEDAYQAFLKLLKENSRMLLITGHRDEDLSKLENLDNIKIVKVRDLSDWNQEELSEILLKIIFTPSVKKIFTLKSKNGSSSKKPDKIRRITEYPVSAITTRKIRGYLPVLLSLFVFAVLIGVSTFAWYFYSVKNIFADLKNNLTEGNMEEVRLNLAGAEDKIIIAKGLFNMTSVVFFPLKNSTSLLNLGQMIDSTDRMLTVVHGSINLIDEIKAGNQNYPLVNFNFSKSNFNSLVETVSALDFAAGDLQEKIVSTQLPYFPKENLLPMIVEARQNLASVKETVPVLETVFSSPSPKTYLLLFQNNMELRATGGFIGSVGLLTITSGLIEDFRIMDVYSLDGQLKGHVEPPLPIRLYLNQPNWFLRDSNFDPDFAKASIQAEWFIRKILNKEIDGVIGINLFFVQDLLAAVGPVTLADFGNEVITADNLFVKSQLHIQSGFFEGSSTKKDFLTALSQSLQTKVSAEKTSIFKLAQVVKKSLDEKNILIYLNDGTGQNKIEHLGWGGRIFSVNCLSREENCLADYLYLVDSNLGVNKANFFIKKSANIRKKINKEGQIETELEISMENQGSSAYLQGGVYTDYLRIIVPRGSRLVSANLSGREIEKSSIESSDYQTDKTSFGMLLKIPELKLSRLFLTFLQMNPVKNNIREYQFYMQKQPGDKSYSFNLAVESAKINFQPKNFSSVTKEGINIASDTSVDRIFTFNVSP